MIDQGKKNVIGVYVDAIDYEAATHRIVSAAKAKLPFAVSALAVHGIMTGYTDEAHRIRLNTFDLVTPDGQPVRWAMNLLYGANLPDRVYGPTLMLKTCEEVAREGLKIYLYGSKSAVLDRLANELKQRFPNLIIAGTEPSKFRKLTDIEKAEVVDRIKASGADLVFVGLGCPRQEVWAYEYREALSMPIMAVGAAFDFHAGNLPQAPRWMQDNGLEWLFRLNTEPRRLWRRYMLLNPWYVILVTLQMTRLRHYPIDKEHVVPVVSFG